MFFQQRVLSTREQARLIRKEVIALVDKANEFSVGSRRVNRKSAYKVISRSLNQSRGLPFSIRKHKAITDLSNYIALAKHNKVVGLLADHTDLLPISHPRSTRLHAMSASALVQAKIRWYTDDPRIKDDNVKSLVASAMSAPTQSPEYKYALARLENLPASELPIETLTAAVNPYAGKNSAAARRAREAVQLSDRFERWINMGRSLQRRATDGFRSYVRRNDGTTRSHSGAVLNQNMFSPQLIDIEVGKGRVATVPVKSGEGLDAFIKDPDSIDGFSEKEAAPTNAPVIPESSIVFSDAPSIYRKEDDYRGKGTKYTDDKYDIIKFDNPKDAMPLLDESNKRAAELDKPAPKQLKAGETDPDTGKQFWNPDEPVFAVARRGQKTNFAFAQSWKDVNNEILRDEPDLDEEEGRDYTRPEPRTSDDTVPLLDQADQIFDGKKREEKPEPKEGKGFPFTVPDRAYDFDPTAQYTPEFDFDDPEFLAGVDTPDLEDALFRSVEPVSATERATGFAPVDLPDGRTEEVSSEAIAAALDAQGQDPEMALAKAYDKIAGNTENEDALMEARTGKKSDKAAEPTDLEEKFDEVVETEPEVLPEPEITEEGIDLTPEEEGMPIEALDDVPAFKGLSDEEKQDIFDTKNYDKYIPKNEDIEVPEGMYKPGESSEKDRSDAIEMAAAPKSVAPNKLLNEKLKEAMEGDGTAQIPGADENGEPVDFPVSAESLRDAIALRGKDANAAVKKIAKPKKEAKPEEPEAEAKPEEPVKKQVTYKRAGKRTLLRGGKGAPFRDKDVADFLAENGFEWSDTVERDGKVINVKAQTKLQDDEEFKAFARELRDRFGIDLQPRAGEEPIDIDAPAPVKEEPTPTPEAPVEEVTPEPEAPVVEPEAPAPAPELTKEEQKIKDLERELEMLERLIQKDDVKPEVKELMADRIDTVKEEIKNLKSPETEESEEDFDWVAREKEINKKILAELVSQRKEIKKAIDEALKSDQPNAEELKALIDAYDELTGRIDMEILGLNDTMVMVDGRSPEAQVVAEILGSEETPTVDNLIDKLKEKSEEKLDAPFGSRKDMISKLMWFKWGAGFRRNESPYIRAAMRDYENKLKELSDEDMIDMLNLYYDEIDADMEARRVASDRAKIIAEAKKARRKAYEDSLIEEFIRGKKGEAAKPTPEAPTAEESKKPTNSLKEGDEFYLPGVGMVKVKKVTYAPVPGRGLFVEYEDKDGKTGNTEIFDKFVETRAPEAKTEEAPAAPEAESTPASSLVKKVTVKTSELKPGDVKADDFFTITKIEQEGTKPVRVDGQVQEVPAYRVTGYYPGSVEQSSKLWSDNYAPEIYRGATPPAQGDLPELNQPKAEDYGDFAYPNQTKVKYKDRTLWAPKDKALADKFLEDYKAYDEELNRRKAMWQAPEVLPENDESKSGSPTTPNNPLYTDSVPASEVKEGDIAFRRDKDGLKEFFVVTKVVSDKDGTTTLEGHYVGHQTQTKEWRSGTNIEVIRGETNLPAAGDKEPLDRPDKTLPNYAELEKARKEKIAEADKGYSPVFATSDAFKGVTPLESKPNLPAFYGSAEELLALGDGSEVMKALDEKGFIVFDSETIGKDVANSLNPDAPIQVAASKYLNGEKVEELNLFINPGEPLSTYYYETDEAGNRVLKADRLRDSEGNPITDEWLATQPDVKEQLQKLLDFFGEKPILVGQNNTFDINLLERWAEKLGLEFSMGGAVDTLAIAKALQAKDQKSVEFPENPADGDVVTINGADWKYSEEKKRFVAPSNALKPLAERLGVSTEAPGGFHDAAFDIDVTEKVLRALMDKVKSGDFKTTGATKKYDAGYDKWIKSRDQRIKDIAAIQADRLLSGKTTDIDAAVGEINAVGDEKVVVVDGEETVVTPKVYKSAFSDEVINKDWVEDPENTTFIENARIKDLKLGDFIVGKNGNYQEVVAFGDDESDPANAIKVFRADIEDGVVLENRDSVREDGGTGFFLNGRLEGGIFRPNGNKDKSSAQINVDSIKPEPVDETPVVIEPVAPVKGEELTDDQVKTVVADAIDDITSGTKSEATIEEAVKGSNIDETIKEQVLGADRAKTSEHLTREGVQLAKGDRVINTKNKKTGRVVNLFDSYGKAGYSNYAKIKYDDGSKGPVASDSLSIIDAATDGYTPRVINAGDILRPADKTSTKTVQDVVDTIKTIQSKPTPEGVNPPENIPDPVELAKTWKDKEAERNRIAEEMNFVSTSPEVVSAIKANLPGKVSTESFMPSLKTGEPMNVTFGFDKPTGRELSSYAEMMKISGPDDILVFKATPEYILRKEHLATIKPDGTITWVGDNQKNTTSIDLKNALDTYTSPIVGLQAMAVMPEDDDEEPTPSALGTDEDVFDYSRIASISPTSEQRSVIDAVMTGKNVVVRALAGTGKTSTLKLAAKRLKAEKPDKKITYIVFNKSVQVEASKEFPDNTDPRTADSIGYWNVDPALRDKARKAEFIQNNPDISKHLGIVPTPVKVKGTEQNLSTRDIPKILRDALDKFTASDDDKVTLKHFAGMNLDEVPPAFIEWANKWWEDLSSPTGKLYTSPSDLTKAWALSKPDFSKGIIGPDAKGKPITRDVDVVMYDEAQDINPVMAKVMREQKDIQVVYVGDSNQAIYGFRGAIDELDNVKADYDLPITETFRFGEKIAGMANRFLTKLESKYRVKGLLGKDGEILDVMDDPTVIITRTNGGGISAMLEMLEKNKVVGIDEKTFNDYESLIKDIEWLMRAGRAGGVSPGARRAHKDLASFNTWAEVISAVQKGESLGSAAYMVNILRDKSPQDIKDVLSRIEKITNKPEPTAPYVPVTLDDLKDGSKGVLGYKTISKGGRQFPVNVEYSVENGTMTISNGGDFSTLLRGAGFEYNPEKYTYSKKLDNKQELLPLFNKIKRAASGYKPEKPIEVEIITAHKAKGKQWKRVRIFDDFKGPELSEEDGTMKLPAPEEMRLSYVAITRAEEALELGSLAWITDVTSEADESANLSPVEELLGMKVGQDIDPVTAEEAVKSDEKTVRKLDEQTELIADKIIEMIEKGTPPWRKPWTGGGFLPTSVSSGKPYQGSNVLYLWAVATSNGWTDNRWLTYNQAKKLGGNIKKGEKATYIIHWTPKFRDVEQPDGTITKQFYWTPPKFIPVFNVEQAENIKLPPLIEREPVPVTEAEQVVLNAYKDKPEIVFKAQDQAFYTPSEDKIYMPLREQFANPQDLFETLMHELAHSTGHKDRLGKEGKRKELQDNYGNHRASRGEEELIAEISVAILASELGIEIDWGNVAAYADSWLKPLKDDKAMIITAAKMAQDAVNYMLGKKKEEDEEGAEKPVGEGVGSEGKTGEEVAAEAPAAPAETPEPNVGTEGQTGEEVAKENIAKNRDTSITNKKYKDPETGEEWDLWEDVTFEDSGERGGNNEGLEELHGMFASRLLADGEYMTDRAEIDKYIADTLEKYGYGKKFFALANKKTSDAALGPIKEDGGFIEAGVGLANKSQMPEGNPLKELDFPLMLVRSRGIKKVALLHEIAHMMEGSWKNGKGGGHNMNWYATFLALLDGEGFKKESNLLRSVAPIAEGDTGAINR